MAHHSEGHHGHHIIPFKTLAAVFAALVFLTIITVLTAKYVDLGSFNVPLAIALASTKAGLVVTIFMGLKYDNKVNVLAFSIGSLFVVVFLSITLLDTAFRGDSTNVDPLTIMEQEMELERLEGREPDPADLRIAPGDYAGDDQGSTMQDQ
jgi:cytochrome c oxidase subunit 4